MQSKRTREIINSNYRRQSTDITVCDLVGIGFQDAIIGNCVYKEFKKSSSNKQKNYKMKKE